MIDSVASHSRSIGLAALLAGAAIAIPSYARAQDMMADDSWRRPDRPPAKPHDPLFDIELRFGPYWPDVDGGFSGTPPDCANASTVAGAAVTNTCPYYKTFGSKPNFYFGLEFDFTPLRIPYIGAFGPGFGWGWTSASAPAVVAATGKPSTETTSLTIMPMHLSAVLRADELMRRTGIPIVPYVKIGPGVGVWTASNSLGTSVVGTTTAGKPCSQSTPDAQGCVQGKGVTWGLNLALGAAFSMNFLDPAAASLLEHGSDVAHVYLFGEWMNAMLTGFGAPKEMHVGTSTIVVGLSADF